MARIVAVTGTPGTGKSTLARAGGAYGYRVIELAELAERRGATVGRDEKRDVVEVDVDLLVAALEAELEPIDPGRSLLVVGHLSHLMPCDIAVVLRCSPAVLKERLAARGYPPEKVRENVEAEAVDVILVEALDEAPPGGVFEIDTTSADVEASLASLLAILEGSADTLRAGHVDWSAEVMEWF